MADRLEDEVMKYLIENRLPVRIKAINERIQLYVTNDGEVYKARQYPWERAEQLHFRREEITAVRLGKIDPSEIKKDSRQIRKLAPGGDGIGQVSPYTVHTESGEQWDDFIVSI